MSSTPSPATSPAELRSTPVDGVDVLGALSPSRASDFMTCPLLYRYRTIDRLPEELRAPFIERVLAAEPEPLRLEYVRLNIEARA